jgi:hypothetical protein
MLIVLSKRQEGKDMPNTQNIETTLAAPANFESRDQRGPSPSRVDAAVEAAYILEAVRK